MNKYIVQCSLNTLTGHSSIVVLVSCVKARASSRLTSSRSFVCVCVLSHNYFMIINININIEAECLYVFRHSEDLLWPRFSSAFPFISSLLNGLTLRFFASHTHTKLESYCDFSYCYMFWVVIQNSQTDLFVEYLSRLNCNIYRYIYIYERTI